MKRSAKSIFLQLGGITINCRANSPADIRRLARWRVLLVAELRKVI